MAHNLWVMANLVFSNGDICPLPNLCIQQRSRIPCTVSEKAIGMKLHETIAVDKSIAMPLIEILSVWCAIMLAEKHPENPVCPVL